MTSFYLMESEIESERLRIKNNYGKTQEQLIATGLTELGPRPSVIDAGSGVGHVAEVMGDLLQKNGQDANVTLLDLSEKRLSDAQARMGRGENEGYHYVTCDVCDQIPLRSHSADYVIGRFLFEYLADPQAGFNELLRLVKPGGKLIIGDLDYNCMTHYPLEPDLERDLAEVMRAVQVNRLFDPFVGRKIYSYFYNSPLKNIKVHFYAHHLFYGALSSSDEFNWLAKLDQLIRLQQKGTIQLDTDLETFRNKFHEFLKSPGRFSYTPLILVEGTKS